jgi:hypothetical protein
MMALGNPAPRPGRIDADDVRDANPPQRLPTRRPGPGQVARYQAAWLAKP